MWEKRFSCIKITQNCVEPAIAFVWINCEKQLLCALLRLITFICTTFACYITVVNFCMHYCKCQLFTNPSPSPSRRLGFHYNHNFQPTTPATPPGQVSKKQVRAIYPKQMLLFYFSSGPIPKPNPGLLKRHFSPQIWISNIFGISILYEYDYEFIRDIEFGPNTNMNIFVHAQYSNILVRIFV